MYVRTGSKEPRTVPYTRTLPDPYPYHTRTVQAVPVRHLSAPTYLHGVVSTNVVANFVCCVRCSPLLSHACGRPTKKKRASHCCRLGACGKLSAHKGFQVWHRSNQLPAIANLPRN